LTLLVESTAVVWASLASVVHQLIVISGRTVRLVIVVIIVMIGAIAEVNQRKPKMEPVDVRGAIFLLLCTVLNFRCLPFNITEKQVLSSTNLGLSPDWQGRGHPRQRGQPGLPISERTAVRTGGTGRVQ
jgi:hypothetical protein